jgi:hypothetical protein
MATIDFTTLDLTPYQSAPSLPADALLTLANDLGVAQPIDPPVHVKKAAKRMFISAQAVNAILIQRIEGGAFDLIGEVTFDTTTDRFWSSTREQCQLAINYADPGLEQLSEAEQAEIDLPSKRELAEVARKLHNHLFAENGLAFLKKPMREQVVAMATRLEFIATSEEHDKYEAVLGSGLLKTLRVLQGRYEAIVHSRATRADTIGDLRAVRRRLQRDITMYATTVLSLLDEDDPESAAKVLAALRPMVYVRELRASPGGGAPEPVVDEGTIPMAADDELA